MTVPFYIKTKNPACNQITSRNVLLFHIANVSCFAAGDVLGVSKPSTDKSVHHSKKRQVHVHVLLTVILASSQRNITFSNYSTYCNIPVGNDIPQICSKLS